MKLFLRNSLSFTGLWVISHTSAVLAHWSNENYLSTLQTSTWTSKGSVFWDLANSMYIWSGCQALMTGRTLCRMLLVDTWRICTFMCLSQPMLFVLPIHTVYWKRMRFILDFLISGNINRLKNQSSTTKDFCLQTREKPRNPSNNNNWLSEIRGCFRGKEDARKSFERVCDELEAYNDTAGGYSSIMKL